MTIVNGPKFDPDADVNFWLSYLYSRTQDDTGSSGIATFNPEAAAATALEKEAPPDIGPIFEPYDPEVQALLAYE